MILYLDTSALVKLFVEEPYSRRVREAVSEARLVVTHAIAYVEACAAFARLAHDRKDVTLLAALRSNLDVQWESWDILSPSDATIRRAADLAGRYRLRAYDSVHLAAVQQVLDLFQGGTKTRCLFAVFDGQLSEAARSAGVPLLE